MINRARFIFIIRSKLSQSLYSLYRFTLIIWMDTNDSGLKMECNKFIEISRENWHYKIMSLGNVCIEKINMIFKLINFPLRSKIKYKFYFQLVWNIADIEAYTPVNIHSRYTNLLCEPLNIPQKSWGMHSQSRIHCEGVGINILCWHIFGMFLPT